MSVSKKITRRAMIQVGLGAAAGVATGKVLTSSDDASACETPAQTEGPFYPKHQQADKDLDLTRIEGHAERAAGEVVYVSGLVLGDDYKPIPGALVDVWQANVHGRYHHEDDPNPAPVDEHFQGWGQIKTDAEGRYAFKTIVPGAYPATDDWWRPPHIHFKVSRRGYHEVITQMYFAGHELNDKDAILQDLPEAEQEKVVVAFTEGLPDDEPGSRRGTFNIMLRRVRTG